MRRLFLIAFLGLLVTACGTRPPWSAPAPTPTRFVPSQLLTPRPTDPPVTPTPVVLATATPETVATRAPTATPTPIVVGTPVTVTEPLRGMLLDDRLFSPI